MVVWIPNCYATGHLNCKPFDKQTNPHDLNTKQVLNLCKANKSPLSEYRTSCLSLQFSSKNFNLKIFVDSFACMISIGALFSALWVIFRRLVPVLLFLGPNLERPLTMSPVARPANEATVLKPLPASAPDAHADRSPSTILQLMELWFVGFFRYVGALINVTYCSREKEAKLDLFQASVPIKTVSATEETTAPSKTSACF